MAKGNNIHDEVKEQRKKLKELTFSGKVQYIWEYYRVPIISVILAVLFVLAVIIKSTKLYLKSLQTQQINDFNQQA